MSKTVLTALRDAIRRGKLEQVKSMLPPIIATPEPVLGSAAVNASFKAATGLVEVTYDIKVTEPNHYLAVHAISIVTGTDELVGGTAGIFSQNDVQNNEYSGTLTAMVYQLSGQALAVTVWGWLADATGVVAVLQAETSVDVP